MKSGKRILGMMIVALAALFIMVACSKEEEGSISTTDLSLAQDDTYADAVYEEVDNFVVEEVKNLDDNAYAVSSYKSTEEDACYTVTVDHPDLTSFPKVITVDFGTGCQVVFKGDTITRAGKIIITLTNRWYVTGAQHIVTFNNFYMNGVKIEGTRTITNVGLNEKNRLEHDIELENGKLVFNDTTWMTREASHVREWSRQQNPLNDSIFLSGSASGTNILGETYQREITEPLVLVRCEEYHYHWVMVDGTIEITNSERGTTTVDYSSDGCQSGVIVKKDGKEYRYEFRFRNRNHANNN